MYRWRTDLFRRQGNSGRAANGSKAGGTIRAIEGKPETAWVLVDAGGVIIHLFLEWSRKEIKLDDLVGERINKLVSKEA